MDNHDINGAKVIVRHLCRAGLSWHRNTNPRPRAWEETYSAVGSSFFFHHISDPIEKTFLAENEDEDFITGEIDGPYILLEPPSNHPHIVCLLGIYWNLTKDVTELGPVEIHCELMRAAAA